MSHQTLRVLVLCTANSARSQMAEGILRHHAPGYVEVVSAGTAPTSVRPEAIAVLAEIGIDISAHWSKHVDSVSGTPFDYLITVCDHAREVCPVLPGIRQQLHWSLPDPAAVADDAARLHAFREVRDSLLYLIDPFVRTLRPPVVLD